MTTIQITRPNEWANRIRRYKIYLDNVEQGTIANNTTLDLYVTEGKHKLVAKMAWYSSKEMEIDIKENEIKYVKVTASTITKWFPFLSIPFFVLCLLGKEWIPQIQYLLIIPILLIIGYMLTVGRKNYLDLKEF